MAVARHFFLFEQLVRRELRRRYRGSALGLLWYAIQPLVLMAAYAVVFGVLLRAVDVEDYPLFLFCGLVVWTFAAQALLGAAGSLVEQAAIVGQVRFPRALVPASGIAVHALTAGALLLALVPVAWIVRGAPGPELLLLPPLALLLTLLLLGLGLVVAVLHAHFRDVQPVLAAALLPLFFLTPVFYRVEDLPGLADHAWAGPLLSWANPLAPYVEAIRDVVYDGRVPAAATLAYTALAAPLALALGLAAFRRGERDLAVVL